MSDAAVPVTPPAEQPQIRMRNLIWALLAVGVMVVVIALRNFRLINFVHEKLYPDSRHPGRNAGRNRFCHGSSCDRNLSLRLVPKYLYM